jgi:hypothetical protein
MKQRIEKSLSLYKERITILLLLYTVEREGRGHPAAHRATRVCFGKS